MNKVLKGCFKVKSPGVVYISPLALQLFASLPPHNATAFLHLGLPTPQATRKQEDKNHASNNKDQIYQDTMPCSNEKCRGGQVWAWCTTCKGSGRVKRRGPPGSPVASWPNIVCTGCQGKRFRWVPCPTCQEPNEGGGSSSRG